MAVRHGYGKIAGTDALVFAYDTGDTRNSYKGEPTVNYITTMAANLGGNVSLSYPNNVYICTAQETNVVDPTAPGGQYSRFTGNTDSDNNQLFTSFVDGSVNARNTTVAYSVYLKGTGTCHLTVYSDIAGYSITPTITLTSEWTRYSIVQAVGNYTTHAWAAVRGILTSTNVYVAAQQVEFKSHVTPFINGTRSATQGLLDLTGNSTIDLTDVSFDSSAEMTFDGSDDYVSVEYSTAINTPNGATYEIMVYPQGAGEFLTRGKSDSGTDPDNPRFYVGGNGNIYFDWSTTGADTYVDTVTGTATLNQWNHIVGVAQPGDQLRVYVNGVQASYGTVVRTLPATLPNTSDPIIIGGATWIPRYFTGKVGMVKLYNRNLTPTEIKENFNGIRSRYGI